MRYISGMTIQNIREKPDIRERLLKYGAERLSDTDLLAVLLHTGIANKPVTKLAEEIVRHIDTRKTESIEAALKNIHGIGNAKRQPRCPSIGFASWSCSTRSLTSAKRILSASANFC